MLVQCSLICAITLTLVTFLQDSFYHNLTPEELARVHDYNFDHPGQSFFLLIMNLDSVLDVIKDEL